MNLTLRLKAFKLFFVMLLLMAVTLVNGQITKKILFVDEDYYSRYAGDTKTAQRYFLAQNFTPMTAPQIYEFMKNGHAPNSVILSLTDISPKIWAEPFDKTSVLFQYLLRGGRFVAPGGNTLTAFIGKDDIFVRQFGSQYYSKVHYPRDVFGIKSGYGLRGKDRKLTPQGKVWGLDKNYPQWATYLDLGVYSNSVTPLVTAQKGTIALVYYKNFNKNYPYSGLVGACFNLRNHLPTLESIYRMCLFNGKPIVKVPRVDYKEKKQPAKDFALNIAINNIPRNVFECGETIPVKVVTTKNLAYKIKVTDDKGFELKNLNTKLWKEGFYTIECIVNNQVKDTKKIYIAPKRKNQNYPIFIWKSARPHFKREKAAANFIRKNYLNTCIDDIHQMTGENLDRLGNVIDETLRYNQLFTARTSIIRMYTQNKEDQLVLYNKKVHYHGKNHPSASSRAIAAKPEVFTRQTAQIKQLLDAKAPNFSKLTVANDDGSMLGNFDFNPKTIADFEAKTQVKYSSLPKFVKVKHGNQLYFPVVAPGIVSYNHPFLQYFRYHTGNYSKIASQTTKASLGVKVGDIGLMSGPIYPGRGFYPALSHKDYTLNTFYNYTFWYSALAFNIESVQSAGRAKDWGAVVSAHYTQWGKEFQKGILYRLIANAPGFIGLWHLDDSTDITTPQFKSTWEGTLSVTKNLAQSDKFYKLQKRTPRKCAFLYDIAQICFQVEQKNAYPYSRYSAVENFRRAGGNADIITSEEVVSGILKNYDVVILHDTQWMTDKVHSLLVDYIKKGGKVIGDKTVKINIPGMIKSPNLFGMGLAHIGANSCVAQYTPFIKKFQKEPIVKCTDINAVLYYNQLPDKTPLVWVLDCETNQERRDCQTAMNKNWKTGAFTYLTQRAKATGLREHKLKVNDKVFIYDLFNHKEVPVVNNIASIKLSMLDAVPLLLLKDKIAKVEVNLPKAVLRGKTLTMNLTLKNSNNQIVKGMVPGQVKVSKDGKELFAYGSNVIFKDGKAVLAIDIPINETTATWNIKIKELASNKTTSRKVIIK